MNLRAKTSVSKLGLVFLVILLLCALFIHLAVFLNHGLLSDEAVYTYSGYAISKGVIPYKNIYLAHPPLMYYLLAGFITIFGQQIIFLRLINIGIFLITAIEVFVISFWILKKLSTTWRESLSLCATAVFLFFPSYYYFIHIEVPLDNMLCFFSFTAFLAYFLAYVSSEKRLFFISGIFLGLTALITLRAVFFIAPIFLFHLFDAVLKQRIKTMLPELAVTFIGTVIPIGIATIYLNEIGAVQQFYIQNIFFQNARPSNPIETRVGEITVYLSMMLPLIILGIAGTVYCVKQTKFCRRLPVFSLPFLYFFGVAGLAIFTDTTAKHYFYYLTPYLSILSCLSLPLIAESLMSKKRMKCLGMIFLICVGIATQITTATGSIHQLPWFNSSLTGYMEVHNYIGGYIKNITDTRDKIWTSEGAIAFFADRLIAQPNSTNFPFHAFFEFELIFYSDFAEQPNFGLNKVSVIQQFEQSWEAEKVKVLVFIRGSGWLPYPDTLMWEGFNGEQGISQYVIGHYELICEIKSEGIPYIYDIWIRKEAGLY